MEKFFALILVGLVGVVGCEQAQTIVECGENVGDAAAPFVLAPLNQACVEHADCASNECVPTVDAADGFAGSCWSDTFRGCEEVNFEAWVIEAFCGERALSVCQLELTPQQQAICDPPTDSLAPWIANFMCCDKP